MIKITFQRAKELNLIIESGVNDDLTKLIEQYHELLQSNPAVKEIINHFVGDNETILYLLADNFEIINMTNVDQTLNMIVPEVLTVFTDKRILSFKNLKNKAYYRNKNQVPGLERKLHLFDSCTIFKYSKIEQIFLVKNSISIHYMNSTSIDKFDRGILNMEIPDFCFTKITKLLGNNM